MTQGSITPPNRPDDEWLVVYESYDSLDAHVVKGRLEHEGIRAMVLGDPFGNAMGIHIGSIGVSRVLVSPENYIQAEAILAEDASDEDLDEDEALNDGNVIYPDDQHQ